MACPPGKILNPHTLRCITSRGRIAKELVKAGDIDAGELRYDVAAPVYRHRRQTARFPRSPVPMPMPYWQQQEQKQPETQYGYYAAEPRPMIVEMPPTRYQPYGKTACPLGYEKNPKTGRCIRVGGRTFKRIYPGIRAAPVLEIKRKPPPPPLGVIGPKVVIPGASRPDTTTGPASAPLGDRRTMLTWAAENCENAVDPLTRVPFLSAPTDSLQELLRLHDGTCTFATPLNALAAKEHKAGKITTIPGSVDRTPLTLEDFRVLRDTMRRKNPAYKLPARKHAPPPPEWKLYLASDTRSGPDYATVAFVDVTKGRRTMYGTQFPPESFRVDMGFLPAYSPQGTFCSVKTISELLKRLADENKLLVPTAGGWRPIAGFPFTKAQWEDGHKAQRLGRLCKDLARALTSPL